MEHCTRLERIGAAPPPPLEDDDPIRPRIIRVVPREIENIILSYIDGRALRKAQSVSKDWHQRCSVAISDRERLLLGPWTTPQGIVALRSDHSFIGAMDVAVDGKWFTCTEYHEQIGHEVDTLHLRGRFIAPAWDHAPDRPLFKSIPLYKMNGGLAVDSWTRGALPGFVRMEMDAVLAAPPAPKAK